MDMDLLRGDIRPHRPLAKSAAPGRAKTADLAVRGRMIRHDPIQSTVTYRTDDPNGQRRDTTVKVRKAVEVRPGLFALEGHDGREHRIAADKPEAARVLRKCFGPDARRP